MTARTQASELDLDESRLILDAVAAQIPGAVYRMRMTDAGEYEFTYVSEGARNLFGLRPDQSVTDAAALFGAIQAEDIAEIETSTRRCNETLERWSCDFRVLGPGWTKWVRGEGAPHRATDGRIVWDGILTDVTEQKAAAERERRLLQRISAILESTTDAVYTLDARWRLTYLNRRAQKLLAPGEDAVGRCVWELFPEAGATALWDQYHRVRDEGCSAELEMYYHPLRTWFEVHAHPHEGGVAVFFRDITGRREAAEELRAAKEAAEAGDRAKSAFLATMSHELRTPLNAIAGFSEMMAQEVLGPLGVPEYRNYARDIRQSSTHLSRIISDVLDMARLEAGGRALDREVIDLEEVLDEELAEIAPDADLKHLLLRRTVPADCPYMLGDRGAVKQVIRNLLSNAVKFTNSGEVEATVDVYEGGLMLSIRDTGIGIGIAAQEHICRPFQQLDASLARRYHGVGIGLALTKRLVELHDGSLDIESAAGAGTTVSVRFPVWRSVGQPGVR